MKSLNPTGRSFLLVIFLFLFMVSLTGVGFAQTLPPGIMTLITSELQKRGLTESEVRVRLLQEGIDPEKIPPAELPQYQTRVISILDELQNEKKAVKTPGSQNITEDKAAVNAPGNDSAKLKGSETGIAPITTVEEAIAETSQRIILAASKKDDRSAIYGHSLFTDKSLDVFRTTDGAQAPDTYVLGEGDEIRILIFGASQTDIQQKIDVDGSIQPVGVAKIFLKGLTLAQAREVIRNRLASAYTFRSDQLAVTMVTARTIMVNVFGEVKIAGGFTISALNSPFNALAAAGGPTEIGSVRNIRLIRGNTRKNIDLYAFMNDPAIQFKYDLQNNDILHVPVARLLVSIEGPVKRPMRYEMLPEETLVDLIRYAGDVDRDAYPDFVQIQRYINGEQRLTEYNLAEVLAGKTRVELMNGDVVRIKAIGRPLDQFVDIEGTVYYPGRYDISASPVLSKLIGYAKPTFEAKTDIVFVERTRADSTIEVISVPFPGRDPAVKDFALQPRDRVRIMNQAAYRDVAPIAVSGHVRVPFQKSFALTDRITVNQAIEMAGGLKSSAYPVAYIFRRNLLNPVETSYVRVELSQSDKIYLQAGDQLNVYDNATFSNVGEVRVFGAVKNPKGFTYDPSLTVRDVLINAGGFTVGAALNRVEVFRTTLSPTEKPKLEMITLRMDSGYQVVTPADFTLQPYDQVVVRLTPEFTLGRTVEISGEVLYPGAYVIDSKEVQLSEIIKRAGGLLETADPYGSRLFRTYNKRGNISMNLKDALLHAGNLKSDPILFEGDVINVYRRENTVTIRGTGTRMAQYSIYPEKTETKNVIFDGARSARWYIRNYAGGFDRKVDRNSVTVVLPNDQMLSTKHVFFMRNYPKVHAGSIISMQMKPPKEKTVEGKKTDWEGIFGKTTQGLMSILTMYLLINQIAK